MQEKTTTFALNSTGLPPMNLKCLLKILAAALMTVYAANASADEKKFTLVIDAGHGGRDPGAIGIYSKEKNINLSVALELGRLVESGCPDVKVVYTRKKDVSVNLQDRAIIANRARADLFISVHTNALEKGRTAYGAETYTLGMARSDENLAVAKRENSAILVEDNYSERYARFNPNSSESYIIFEFMQDEYMKQSASLAKSIQRHYVKTAGRQDKGVHQAGFLVLRETSMPSVLTELGFISTPAEEAYLNSDKGVKDLARSIYEGFLDYKQSQDGKQSPAPPYPATDSAETTPAQEPQSLSGQEVSGGGKEKTEPRQGEARMTDDGIILIGEAARTGAHPAPQENAGAPGAEPAAEEEAQEQPSPEKAESGGKGPGGADSPDGDEGEPVFKIQFLTSGKPLKENDRRLKGLNGIESYTEDGITKYTCEPTCDYNEAREKLKKVRETHPDAFLVAFKGGGRVETAEAIREARERRKR